MGVYRISIELPNMDLIPARKTQSSIIMDMTRAYHPSFINFSFQPVQNGGFEK